MPFRCAACPITRSMATSPAREERATGSPSASRWRIRKKRRVSSGARSSGSSRPARSWTQAIWRRASRRSCSPLRAPAGAGAVASGSTDREALRHGTAGPVHRRVHGGRICRTRMACRRSKTRSRCFAARDRDGRRFGVLPSSRCRGSIPVSNLEPWLFEPEAARRMLLEQLRPTAWMATVSRHTCPRCEPPARSSSTFVTHRRSISLTSAACRYRGSGRLPADRSRSHSGIWKSWKRPAAGATGRCSTRSIAP